MTYTATNPGVPAHHNLATRAYAALGRGMTRYVDARSRRAQVEELEKLSDEQLAARGLTRDGIVMHVFSDMLYL